MVEYASTRLMSGWTSATVPARKRGDRRRPRRRRSSRRRSPRRTGGRGRRGRRRRSPWWRRGSAPRPGSGPPSRRAARSAAGTARSCPPRRGRGAGRSRSPCRSRAGARRRARRCDRCSSSEPSSAKIRNIATMKPTSPMRVVMKAFLPATAADVALEPERDQQVGAEPDALPPEEGDEEAAAEHEDQHRGDEQVHVGEEPREALVAVHVADRVDVDQRRHAGDEQDEGDRQRVGEEADVDLQPARRQPGEEVDDVLPVSRPARSRSAKNITTDARNGEPEHQAADPPRHRLADALAEQQEDHRAEQRQRRDEPDQVEDVARAHRAVSPSASGRRRRWRRAGAGRSPR